MPTSAHKGNSDNSDNQELPDAVQKELDLIKERILHALEIFPFLSRSGIHQQIGTSTPTGLWQPVLQRCIESGEVVLITVTAKTPLDRTQTYHIYHLAKHTYENSNPNVTISRQPPDCALVA